jgi:PAS domain S-box-containing protein
MMDVQTESIFEGVFNNLLLPMSVIKADPPRFTILALNNEFKKNSRRPLDNAIGRPAFDIYKPWDQASKYQFKLLERALMQAINFKEHTKLPVLFFESPPQDGEPSRQSWWQIEIIPVVNDMGQVTYLMCSTSNVTKEELSRRRADQATEREIMLNEELKDLNDELASTTEELRQSEESIARLNSDLEKQVESRTRQLMESEIRSRSILNALPQIAWTSTPEGEMNFFNQKWYDYTGLSFERSKGWGWREVVHPDDVQYKTDVLHNILSSGKAGEFEVRKKGRDGIYRWHLVRVNPLKNEKGEILYWIGTETDIDEIKKLQYQRDDFISIASHELKTPITSLNAVLQLMDRVNNNSSAEPISRLISQGRRSMQKITALVDDLLNLGRLDKGKMPLNKSVFILSELVGACCNPMSLAGKHRFHITGDKGLRVFADQQRIDQVIVNLVTNAVKYGSESSEIVIAIEKQGDMAKVSVTDKGPGIPADKIPRLFDRYYRVEQTGYQASGLGLGLYISSEIIKRHGGEMGVESEVGKGSTFWFTIPLNA